jgi:2-phospho-L-lactate guanylyltransferase
MVAIVVPFRGLGAKARLAPLPVPARSTVALAMLGDVLGACVAVGETLVVTEDEEARGVAARFGAAIVDDPGGGQGGAVAAALSGLEGGPLLVVNADLPAARPEDLRALERALSSVGFALVAAADGTTNALALSEPHLFAPCYGPTSAARFQKHAAMLGVDTATVSLPNLRDDVDTLADLERLGVRAGTLTRAAIASLGLAA